MVFVSSSNLLYRQLHLYIEERPLCKITYEHQYHSNTVFLSHSLSHFISTVSFFVSPFLFSSFLIHFSAVVLSFFLSRGATAQIGPRPPPIGGF
jgi:hypothetical protein